MNARRNDEQQAEQIQPLDDLASQVQNAEQVKGGFNPQPEPPKWMGPVYRPPVLKSAIR